MPATSRSPVLVDSNVLIDVIQQDGQWYDWSAKRLREAVDGPGVVINPIIYAEVSTGFEEIEEVDDALALFNFAREPLPWQAAFLAGKAFVRYRSRGGIKTSPLPDFFIGAHAALVGLSLLTRDAKRFRDYFPTLHIIEPKRH